MSEPWYMDPKFQGGEVVPKAQVDELRAEVDRLEDQLRKHQAEHLMTVDVVHYERERADKAEAILHDAETTPLAEVASEMAVLKENNEAMALKIVHLETALTKISEIRDSIVGTQTMNWSEHVYPLVAALSDAGFKGTGYDIARKNVGTLLERLAASKSAAGLFRARLQKIADRNCTAPDKCDSACDCCQHHWLGLKELLASTHDEGKDALVVMREAEEAIKALAGRLNERIEPCRADLPERCGRCRTCDLYAEELADLQDANDALSALRELPGGAS